MPIQTRASKKRKKAGTTSVEVVINIPSKAVQKAAKKPKSCHLDRLPNEILGEIFTYLPWSERDDYMLVCKRWRGVMDATPAVWIHPPTIRGTMENIITKIQELKAKCGNLGLRSLSLDLIPYEVRLYEQGVIGMTLLNEFPSSTLQELKYMHEEGDVEIVNKQIWECVQSCQCLKLLDWSTTFTQPTEDELPIDLHANDKPLAGCSLDTFILNVGYNPHLDDAFVNIISKAKRLHLNGRIRMKQLATIFDAVKDTIEDLNITNFQDTIIEDSEDMTWEQIDELQGFQPIIDMPRLKKFCADFYPEDPGGRCPLPTPYRINAPLVTDLAFHNVGMMDWHLLELCRPTLKSFKFDAQGDRMTDRLVAELFNMPELEELRLLSSVENRDYRSNPGYLFETFWKAVDDGETGDPNVSMKDILPKLKKLSLIDDPKLTMERLFKLIDIRHSLGLTPMEELQIFLNMSTKCEEKDVATLKSKVANVDIRFVKDWEWLDSREWDIDILRKFRSW